MSVEENKTLVRRHFEDAPHNPDACEEIFLPHFRFHSIQHVTMNPSLDSSPQSEKAAYEWLKTVWGDWHMTVDEMIAEGDRVMVRWTFHGTHRGEFFGVPLTNEQVTYSGINIFRIADGKIAEIRDIFDRLWLWQQLGVLPETAEFIAKARGAILSQQGGRTE